MVLVPLIKAVKIKNQTVSNFDGTKDYLATGGLIRNTIKTEKVTFASRPSRADLLVKDNQLIVARMAGTNKVYLINNKTSDFIVSTGFLVLEALEGWSPNFLLHYFSSTYFQRQKDKLATGATQKAINNDKFSKILIPYLSLEYQNQIIKYLDQANTLEPKREQVLNLLENYLKSIFLEMFGDPLKNYKKWPKNKLIDLCSDIVDCPHSTPKYSDRKTDYPCVRSSDLQNGFLDFSTTKYVGRDEYFKRIKRLLPKKGDIIYCREGARFGAFAYLFDNIQACLGQRTMLLRANSKISTPEFIWGLMNSDGIAYQANQLVKQAASPHVNVKDIKEYKTFLPPLDLQLKFSEIFKKVILIRKAMLNQAEDLDNLSQVLMQKYFSPN